MESEISNRVRKKVLITVMTYPLPSKKYSELVCTAGVLEDGSWIRIYPIPLEFWDFHKYQWVELFLERNITNDFRPESFKLVKSDLSDMVTLNQLDTKNYWQKRKEVIFKCKIYDSIEELIHDSKAPSNISLAVFKPTEFIDFIVEDDTPNWGPEIEGLYNQLDIFKKRKKLIDKVPFKFYYQFKSKEGTIHKLMISDWEIGQLYRNCLKRHGNDKNLAVKDVIKKYKDEFLTHCDIYLFLGTTLEYHRRRMNNPFIIIGIFYPRKEPSSPPTLF